MTGPADSYLTCESDAKVRCSDWARAAALSPIGTCGTYAGYLLVEIPLPWPRDVAQIPEAGEITALIAPLRYRLQAVIPADPATPAPRRRVILHARPPGGTGFSGYRRFESLAGESLTDTVAALISAAASDAPSRLASPAVDVLVCSHGTRDSCCGRRGAQLAVQLAAAAPLGTATLWRTSHMGGHRFAPTFLVLPEGTSWGFADLDLVTRVVRREGDFDIVASHYRGCTGLGGSQVQALEREVLRQVGWSLLDTPRAGDFDAMHARLAWQDGARTVTWAAEVRPGRTVPVPGCMEPTSSAAKSETEWAVTAVHRVKSPQP
jgi:hypothetical protein